MATGNTPTGSPEINQQIARRGETASEVLAAQSQAVVQARYGMAIKRPRDWDEVRQRLLHECSRTSFAESATYEKPIGNQQVGGLSIRFAEAALRIMTNVLPEAQVIYDDEDKRIVRITVTDLEANVTYSKDLLLLKRVERSSVKPGQRVFGERKNSRGNATYIVEATEDDLAVKEAALTSKVIRQNGLRLVPGDLLEECQQKIRATLEARAKADPDAERKKIVDAFGSLGVKASDLKAYCGAALETLSPAELVQLRAVYQAIRDGETNWRELMEARGRAKGDSATPESGAKTEKLKADLAGRRGKQASEPQTAPEPSPEQQATSPHPDGMALHFDAN